MPGGGSGKTAHQFNWRRFCNKEDGGGSSDFNQNIEVKTTVQVRVEGARLEIETFVVTVVDCYQQCFKVVVLTLKL